MSARLNPDMAAHGGQSPRAPSPAFSLQTPAFQRAVVRAGLELHRLGLSEEQERDLSPEAREALIAARAAFEGQYSPEELAAIGQKRESNPPQHQSARVQALGDSQAGPVVAPFKLDLGRELLQMQLSAGQANQLTSRGRDALVAARVARARARVDVPRSSTSAARPEPQQPAVKLLRLSRVAPCLEHSETMSARLNPDLSYRSSHASHAEGSEKMSARYNPDIRRRSSRISHEERSETMSERLNPDLSRRSSRASRQSRVTAENTEAVMWRELGVALASAQLSFSDEVKLSARGREALNEARASVACEEALDAGVIAAGCRWLEFAEELDAVGMTEVAEKQLSVFARDALAATRGARARAELDLLEPQEASFSKPSRQWMDLGLNLDAVGLSESEEDALSIQGRDALIAARAMRNREKDTSVAAREPPAPHRAWMDLGLDPGATKLAEHDEQSLSKCTKDSLVVERLLGGRGRTALREGGEARLSQPRRDWIEFGIQLDAAGLDEDEELLLSGFARDAIIAARALRARGQVSVEETGEAGLSTSNRQWIEFGLELDAEGVTEGEEQALSGYARGALAVARALRMRGALDEGEWREAAASRFNRRWIKFGAELDAANLGEDGEHGLSAFARDAIAAARIIRARDGLPLTEESEMVPGKSGCSWLDFGRDLDSAGLSEAEEMKLSSQGRDALLAARALRAREADEAATSKANRRHGALPACTSSHGSTESSEAALSKPKRPWIDFGCELDSVGLSEGAEQQLSSQGRDALIAARAIRAREMDEAAASRSNRGAGALPDFTSGCETTESSEAAFSKPKRPWIDFGCELDCVRLSEGAELQLSSQGRDALIAARSLRAREAEEAAASQSNRRHGALPDCANGIETTEGREAALSKPKRPWIDFGCELHSVGLSEIAESQLSSQGRDALIAARALRARETEEAAASNSNRQSAPVADCTSSHGTTEGDEAALSKPKRPWIDFGCELDSVGLSEGAEQQLSSQGRDALIAARALRAREAEEAAASKSNRREGAMPDSMSPPDATEGSEAALSKPKRPWVDFGCELDSVGLSEGAEQQLSSQGRDALIAARALRAREAEEPAASKSNRREGTMPDSMSPPDTTEGGEAALSKPKRPWIEFGCELDSVGLAEGAEQLLSNQGRDALIAARALRAREAEEAAASESSRRHGVLPNCTSGRNATESSEAAFSKPTRPWVDFGRELDSVGLSEGAEQQLSSQGRDALIAARALRAREAEESASSKSNRRAGAIPDSTSRPDTTEGSEAAPSKPSRPWIDFGCELDTLGLSEGEQGELSSQARDALLAARELAAHEADESAPHKGHRRRPSVPKVFGKGVSEDSEAAPSKSKRPWIDFGCELDTVGLTDAEEQGLSNQARDALAAARALRARETNEAISSKPNRSGDVAPDTRRAREDREAPPSAPKRPHTAAPELPVRREAPQMPLSKPNRPWLDFGRELESTGLSESEEKALAGPAREALQVVRALRVREADESPATRVPPLLASPVPRVAAPFTDFWTLNTPRTPRQSTAIASGNVSLTATTHMQSAGPERSLPFVARAQQHDLTVQDEPRKKDTKSVQHIGADIIQLKHVSNEADSASAKPEQTTIENGLSIGGWFRGWTARAPKTSPAPEDTIGVPSAPTPRTDTRELSVDARATSATPMVAMPISDEAALKDSAGTGNGVESLSSPSGAAAHKARHSNDGVVAGNHLDSADSQNNASSGPTAEPELGRMHPYDASMIGNSAMDVSKSFQGVNDSAIKDFNGVNQVHTNLLSSEKGIGVVPRGKTADGRPVHLLDAQAAQEAGQAGTRGTATATTSAIKLEQHLAKAPTSYVPAVDASVAGERASERSDLNAAFDESERQALVKHLNWALRDDPDVERMLPVGTGAGDLFDAMTSGILVSKFMAHVDPSALDLRALNLEHGESLKMEQMLQNHTLCLNAAISVGCGVQGLTASQMLGCGDHQQAALQLIWNITRSGLLNPIDTVKMPELLNLALPGEDASVLSKYRADQVHPRFLLSWPRASIAR
jgi:hypothetical protein